MDDKAHAAIGGAVLGTLFVGVPLGIFSSHQDQPEPEVHTEYRVIHVPSVPKVYTHKEVEYRTKVVPMPDTCREVLNQTEDLVSANDKMVTGSKRWLQIASDGRVSILEDNSSMLTYRAQLTAILERLDTKLYQMLVAQDEAKSAVDACRQDVQKLEEE